MVLSLKDIPRRNIAVIAVGYRLAKKEQILTLRTKKYITKHVCSFQEERKIYSTYSCVLLKITLSQYSRQEKLLQHITLPLFSSEKTNPNMQHMKVASVCNRQQLRLKQRSSTLKTTTLFAFNSSPSLKDCHHARRTDNMAEISSKTGRSEEKNHGKNTPAATGVITSELSNFRSTLCLLQ